MASEAWLLRSSHECLPPAAGRQDEREGAWSEEQRCGRGTIEQALAGQAKNGTPMPMILAGNGCCAPTTTACHRRMMAALWRFPLLKQPSTT